MWIWSFLERDCLVHDSISWPEILLSKGRRAKGTPLREKSLPSFILENCMVDSVCFTLTHLEDLGAVRLQGRF